mmetsp:Transcript_17669/g.57773  ORF Transcript_17669/g.57773 Transcript_17669/m.57773 type:complete len:208 (-) Transcript_17669:41-664(-)
MLRLRQRRRLATLRLAVAATTTTIRRCKRSWTSCSRRTQTRSCRRAGRAWRWSIRRSRCGACGPSKAQLQRCPPRNRAPASDVARPRDERTVTNPSNSLRSPLAKRPSSAQGVTRTSPLHRCIRQPPRYRRFPRSRRIGGRRRRKLRSKKPSQSRASATSTPRSARPCASSSSTSRTSFCSSRRRRWRAGARSGRRPRHESAQRRGG